MSTAKTKTKPPTPKQAVVKVQNLLKGIDNSMSVINREKGKVLDSMKQVKGLVGGLSNIAQEKAVKTAKPVKKAAKKPVKKAAKNPVKKAPVKKAAKKASKPAKATKSAKPAANGRPPLKEALVQIFKEHGPMTPAEAKKLAIEKWGYWSSQSLYNAINKNTDTFKKNGEKVELVGKSSSKKTTSPEVEDFVSKVEKDESVSKTV